MRIIDNIRAFIEKTRLNAATKKDTAVLIVHLNHIDRLLEDSVNPKDNSIDPDKIYEAVHYIETIKLQKTRHRFGFFGNTNMNRMGELFAKNGETILPVTELDRGTESISVPLETKHHNLFGTIHRSLWQAFSTQLRSTALKAWSFSYPLNEAGDVMNQAIGEWQSQQMKLSETTQSAYADFTRDITIDGHKSTDDKQATGYIEDMIVRSNYPEDQKEAIKTWISHNGGQNNNRFIDLLLMEKEYTKDPAANLTSTSAKQNWTIKNGKIVFEFDITSYGLLIDGGTYINKNGTQLEEATIEELIELKENKHDAQKLGIFPILRFKAEVELGIIDKHVVEPRVIALNVTSYNDQLLSPEHLYVNKEQESPRPS
jgi:hypothetical protein